MGHISTLALFDHLTGKVDLSTQELEHLQDCADCHEQAAQLQSEMAETNDVERIRRSLAEDAEPTRHVA